MTEPACTQVREAAAEFALDILYAAEREAIAAHRSCCAPCRDYLDGMAALGVRLLDLVPGTEPPVGFDQQVLARISPADRRTWDRQGAGRTARRIRRPRRSLFAAVAAAAVVVALMFGTFGWLVGRTTSHRVDRAALTAKFHQGTRTVGDVDVDRSNPPWLTITVRGATGADKLTCELVASDGSHDKLGSFDLVAGSGSWGAPDRAGLGGVTAVRLVSSTGRLVAIATLQP